jgi:hypothetical protein
MAVVVQVEPVIPKILMLAVVPVEVVPVVVVVLVLIQQAGMQPIMEVVAVESVVAQVLVGIPALAIKGL